MIIVMNNKCLRCNLATSSIRRDSSHSSEMVSQVIFGEIVEVLKQGIGDWVYIKCTWDNYKGWVDINQFDLILNEETITTPANILFDNYDKVINNRKQILISCGSIIGQEIVDQNLNVNTMNALVATDSKSRKLDLLLQLAEHFLGASYLWGGRSVWGIDCSGLMQILFRFIGVDMPRDASEQQVIGDHVAFYSEFQAGDIAFFENSDRKIVHVGMILDSHKIIHAYGSVRIDRLEENGIYNHELNKITHKLRLVKRVF